MNNRPEDRKISASRNIMMTVSILMAIVYLSFGFWLVISQSPLFNISLKTQRILGSVFLLYSGFRGYVLYSRYFKKRRDIDEIE
jgi:small neutral amino acid transporter SnatA (MarC family)